MVLAKLLHLCDLEKRLETEPLTHDFLRELKRNGFPDKTIARLSGNSTFPHLPYSYKMVDTCGAEFAAETPYFYSTTDEEDEASAFIAEHSSKSPSSSSLAPVRSGSVRESNSTMPPFTVSGH